MSDGKKAKTSAASASRPVAMPAVVTSDGDLSYGIPPSHRWAHLGKIWAMVSLVGAVLAFLSYHADPQRFAFAYLTAFAWGLTLALGALFFVILQHLTSAGWSVVVRRGAEQLMGTLPLFAALFLPIYLFRETLYPWAGHAAHEAAVEAKSGYLNVGFWSVRAALYFVIWSFLALRFFSLSRAQDATGDPALTRQMRALSAPATLVFALSLTFAAFDWLMSLEPQWYSTMFGVYIFAGAVISIMAFLSLLFALMNRSGLLLREVTPEHFHDLGKLLFAFTIFWAYISFAQYFLIWYANIPEETIFYLHRQENGWGTVSIFIVLGHFFFPFFLLLSRHTKRFTAPLIFGAVWVLAMHYVDMYWLVMPNVDHHFHFEPMMDLGCLLFVIGAMLAVMFQRMVAAPIIPIRDPRLDRSLHFENA